MLISGGISYDAETQYPHQYIWKMEITLATGETVEIGYPLTVEFQINKAIDAQTNTANFTIYNLAETTRDKLYQDRFNTAKERIVTFYAGYEGMVQVFKGIVQECYSKRSGTEILTQMQCWDIGFQDQYTSVTFEAGTTFKEAYNYIASQLPENDRGEIGELNGSFKTTTTFFGSPIDILNKITMQHTFIDDGKITTLQNNECIDVPVYQVSASSGLLNTPERRDGIMTAESIFRPTVKIGQLFEIKSEVASQFDGTFKLCGFSHHGTISGAVASNCTTQLSLLIGALLPNSNFAVQQKSTVEFVKVKQNKVQPVVKSYGSSVEEVYRYIKENRGKIPNKQITPDISWRDVLGNNNTDADRYSEITKEILYNIKNICEKLQSYKNSYFGNNKIRITSGWRSSRNNASVGGKNGKHGHRYGNALDFKVINRSSREIWLQAIKPHWPAFSYINSGNAIHVQL